MNLILFRSTVYGVLIFIISDSLSYVLLLSTSLCDLGVFNYIAYHTLNFVDLCGHIVDTKLIFCFVGFWGSGNQCLAFSVVELPSWLLGIIL